MTKHQKIYLGLFGFLVATVGVFYLSGILLFLLFKKDPVPHIGLFTWLDIYLEYGQLPQLEKKLKLSMIAALGICYGLPAYLLYQHFLETRSLHGDARFATAKEIAVSGLLGLEGILVGKYQGKYLMFGGQQFPILAAPTRSGKGVGAVIPNLLNYPDSVVCLDIKQENFNKTAGFRKEHGQDVYLFNPFAEDRNTHRYNPLGYVRDDFRVADLQAIAQVIYPGTGPDPFWDNQAKNLFVGLGLYLCETPNLPKTIGEMLRQSAGDGTPIKKYFRKIIGDREAKQDPLSADCVRALHQFLSASANTMASILSSFTAPLLIWANPIVDAATSANDFDLRQLRKKRMSVYVAIKPKYMEEASKLLNLFFSQLIKLNVDELPQDNPLLKYSCLLLLDEFTAMGRIDILSKGVAYLAGYNLRIMPIIQSVAQLAHTYSPEEARNFMTNHALQIIFPPREQADAREYSEMLGYETVKGVSKSKSRQQGIKRGYSRSESESDQRRALMLPQELRELSQSQQIIMLENSKPILCEKIRYYADPAFKERLQKPPPIPTITPKTSKPFVPPSEALLEETSEPEEERSR